MPGAAQPAPATSQSRCSASLRLASSSSLPPFSSVPSASAPPPTLSGCSSLIRDARPSSSGSRVTWAQSGMFKLLQGQDNSYKQGGWAGMRKIVKDWMARWEQRKPHCEVDVEQKDCLSADTVMTAKFLFYHLQVYKLSGTAMSYRKLYSSLTLDEPHSSLVKKVALTSDKSNQVLLAMMVRKNKDVCQTIDTYSLEHKIKHTKPKPPPKAKVLSVSRPSNLYSHLYDDRSLKASLERRQLTVTPKKRTHPEKLLRTHTKLSIIEFPTFAAQLHLQSSQKMRSQSLVRKQLFNFTSGKTIFDNKGLFDYDKGLDLKQDSYLLTPQEQVLVEEQGEKENTKPLSSIRVRTFKSFQYDSLKAESEKHNYLKPIPVERFFAKLQPDYHGRTQLIHTRFPLKKSNFL